jgi:EAL domain-containing protein (putative c-di-GMP-specific phosphodiesterase class I)
LASWEANIRAVLARLTTVADGVQDETAAEILRGLGIDRAEGVCFAGPVLQ